MTRTPLRTSKRQAGSRHSGGYHRHLVAAGNQRLAHVGGVERLWPVVLAGDEDPHLAPSPVTIVRSVLQMIDQSFATERVSMYSMS